MTGHPDVDMISFTGSTGVGRRTMAECGADAEEGFARTSAAELTDRLSRHANLDEFVDATVFSAYFTPRR